MRLAKKAGTDLTQVGGIERGVRNPTYETLLRLARALDSTPGDLILHAEGRLARG
jgi:transcriptional regulator with XRE-family HTH domain